MTLTTHDIDQVLLRLEEDLNVITEDIKLSPGGHSQDRLLLREAERNLETVQTLKQVFLRQQASPGAAPVPRTNIHKTFGLGKHSFTGWAIVALAVATGLHTATTPKSSPAPRPSLIVSVPPQDAGIIQVPPVKKLPLTCF